MYVCMYVCMDTSIQWNLQKLFKLNSFLFLFLFFSFWHLRHQFWVTLFSLKNSYWNPFVFSFLIANAEWGEGRAKGKRWAISIWRTGQLKGLGFWEGRGGGRDAMRCDATRRDEKMDPHQWAVNASRSLWPSQNTRLLAILIAWPLAKVMHFSSHQHFNTHQHTHTHTPTHVCFHMFFAANRARA